MPPDWEDPRVDPDRTIYLIWLGNALATLRRTWKALLGGDGHLEFHAYPAAIVIPPRISERKWSIFALWRPFFDTHISSSFDKYTSVPLLSFPPTLLFSSCLAACLHGGCQMDDPTDTEKLSEPSLYTYMVTVISAWLVDWLVQFGSDWNISVATDIYDPHNSNIKGVPLNFHLAPALCWIFQY